MRAVGTFLALSALYLAADSAPASLPTSNSTIGTERALTVCSYVPGRVYRFHGMEWGNGSAVTLEQFMALAGPLWLGHSNCSALDAVPSSLTITSPLHGTDAVVTNSTVNTTDPLLKPRQPPNGGNTSSTELSINLTKRCDLTCNSAYEPKGTGKKPNANQPSTLQKDEAACREELGKIKANYERQTQAPDIPKTPDVPNVPPPPAPPNPHKPVRRLNRRAIKPDDPFSKCLPLTSSDPIANPYHEMLTGMPDSATRRGLGYPILLQGDGARCTDSNSDCVYEGTYSTHVEVNIGYSVSAGGSVTRAKLIGGTWGSSTENSNALAVSVALDKTWSTTTTNETQASKAYNVAKTITNTHENSTSDTYTRETSYSKTNTETWNTAETNEENWDYTYHETKRDGTSGSTTDTSEVERANANRKSLEMSQTCTTEKGEILGFQLSGSAGDPLQIFKVEAGVNTQDSKGVTASSTSGLTLGTDATTSARSSRAVMTGWDHSTETGEAWSEGGRHAVTKEWGGSEAITNGHSSSEAHEKRTTDSVSDALTAGVTKESGWSRSQADMNGGSIGFTQGKTDTVSTSVSNGIEISDTVTYANTTETGVQQGETKGYEISHSFKLSFPPGTCKKPACSPEVISVVTPWLCRTKGSDKMEVLTTELQTMQKTDQDKIQCIYELVDCDKYNGFTLFDKNVLPSNAANVLRSGRIFDQASTLTSLNGWYTLAFQISKVNGCSERSELIVKRFDEVIWSSGVTQLGCTRSDKKKLKTRLILNNNGHLVQQATNILIPGYFDEEWLPVWASVPKHLNYMIGVHAEIGYSLVLTNDGYLVLYDGVGAKIWTNAAECRHNKGYLYPFDSLVPTVFRSEVGQDVRNQHPPVTIKWKGDSLQTQTDNCGENILLGGEGLMSRSRNVTLHLEKTGNLIMKQGPRTLWETKTTNMNYVDADATYKLTLGKSGMLYIRDNMNRVIWQTVDVRTNFTYVGPYRAIVQDDGQLIIAGPGTGSGSVVWSSWPAPDIYAGFDFNIFKVYGLPSVMCDECFPCPDYKSLPKKPLINLATSNCTGPTGVDADCESSSKQWIYDKALRLYRNWENPNLCLGGHDTPVSNCTLENGGWLHYADGFIRMRTHADVCLGPDSKYSPCVKSRFEKRWFHGYRTVESLKTNETRVLLSGERIVKGGNSFGLLPNGTLVTSGKKPSMSPLVASPKKGVYYYLELTPEGLLTMKNNNGTVVRIFNKNADKSHVLYMADSGKVLLKGNSTAPPAFSFPP